MMKHMEFGFNMNYYKMMSLLDFDDSVVNKTCSKCSFHKYRHKIVVGRGDLLANILIIGEGPGKSEDITGFPFYGPSGKILNLLLNNSKKRPYFITYTVFCRPCDEFNGDNRTPSENEVLNCRNNVFRVIDFMKPKKVILLGETAKRYYSKVFPDSLHLQHPAFILRTGATRSPYFLSNLRKLEEYLK